MKHAGIIVALVCLAWTWRGFSENPPAVVPTKIDSAHLPNSYRLTERVISGGQPDGEAAFAQLKELGVKTIVSVDAARPDVVMAKKYGLRYVHLPHGYDGIPDARLQELAKALRDLPGPIYVHCHHGKHRSPAAAAAACVAIGALGADDAMAVLKTAGTSENYRGLYQSVRSAKKIDPRVLDKLQVDFRPTVELPPPAEAMVAIEHTHDHLKTIAAAGWKTPADHPDLDPTHEALLLKEHFAELLRSEAVKKRPSAFQQMMRDGQSAAGELEAALASPPADTKGLVAAFAKVTANCQACHQKFRDVPLGEKRK